MEDSEQWAGRRSSVGRRAEGVLYIILLALLVSAVFGTCVNPDAPKVGGFGVGLVLLFDIIDVVSTGVTSNRHAERATRFQQAAPLV